jgi:hypothetical protein
MRARLRFQPALDVMPYRIAPAAIGALSAVVSTAAASTFTANPADTDPPASGNPSPIIIAPIQAPTTLPC